MRIYSNTIQPASVETALAAARDAHQADIYAEDIRAFTSRTAGYYRGVEFYAYSLKGTRASGHAPISPGPRDHLRRAASWDAYGYVIAYLYLLDPSARIGQYRSREDFLRQVRQLAPYRRDHKAEFWTVLETATSGAK